MDGAIIPDDWDGDTYKCYPIRWPFSEKWEGLLLGSLTDPARQTYWDPSSGDPEDAALAVANAYDQTVPGIFEEECVNFLIGQIVEYSSETLPSDEWLFCDGSAVDNGDHPELFAFLVGDGSPFGEDGSGRPFVPDKRGRVALGLDNMGGSSADRVTDTNADVLGGAGGQEGHTLSVAEMPVHAHIPNSPGTHWVELVGTGGNLTVGSGTNHRHGTVTGSTGGGDEHNNMQPWIAMVFIIYGGS